HEHLDVHGTFAAYQAAKALLFRALYRSEPKPGTPRVAVLNADDEGSYSALRSVLTEEAMQANRPAVQVRTYSLAEHRADVYAQNIHYQRNATRFDLVWWDGSFPMETQLVGEFNVANILCAATIALALGVSPQAVQGGV